MPFPNPIDLLCQAVVNRAEEEAKQILAEARRHAEEIVREAEDQAKERVETRVQRLKEERHLEARNIVAATELKARRVLLSEKEALITEILEEGKKRLLDLKTRPQYKKILLTLIEDGLRELPGEKFKVMLSESDHTLVNEEDLRVIANKTGKVINIAEQKANISGGCMVVREDGRLLYDNSLETLFHKKEAELKAEISKRLFK